MPVAIQTRYYGATNHKPSRVKAWVDGGHTLWCTYDSGDCDPFRDAAEALRDKMGWKGELYGGDTKSGAVFVFAPKKGA